MDCFLFDGLSVCLFIRASICVIHCYDILFTCKTLLLYTVRCRYNAVNFHPNPHERHPIARP